ncbi:polymer-forming cytoskeletal protein [Paenibacillus provencensis]|uniref:Polymer-forming cytoskeletal protein n=1 Tax=Paenibacillus provencensis TaxID=441151 RepID=A0ABW3Q7Z5_9BACL|nr:polymer-forming cytoskeletal protein [Paenibacillus sp. MER 78]MCM3128255.1 polymer-forming cytoskeletal protein [Paenibacillus sp. MER 78]
MSEAERRNRSIAGIGTSSGGIYQHVRADGLAKFTSDIDCISYEANGTVSLNGALKCNRYVVNGISKVDGDVSAEVIIVNGTSKAKGNVRANRTRVDGVFSIRGQLETESLAVNGRASLGGKLIASSVEVAGTLSADQDVECEKFEVQGGFKIHGLLNAGDVDIMLHLGCEAEDIGGERIHVRRDRKVKFLDGFVPGLAPKLKAKLIEGDDIYLEQTYAQTVRGNRVVIGPGCQIGLVEYKESYHQDEDTVVDRYIQT